MRKVLLKLISWYQKFSRIFYKRQICVFYPTCSEYASAAIDKYGTWRGALLGVKRVLRCHPWQKNHIDPLE